MSWDEHYVQADSPHFGGVGGGQVVCFETFPPHPKMPSQQDVSVLTDWLCKEQINQSDPVKGRYRSWLVWSRHMYITLFSAQVCL